jgi:hypothetical protein
VRFESAPDAGDGSNIYAIADRKAGSKGPLIGAFYGLDQECSREFYELLNANRPTRHDNGGEIASRYGLRKSPRRNLTGIPSGLWHRVSDFSPCPFGQSLSTLGADTAEQSYVWLVTSILRDSRLERVPYQGA